MLFDKEELKTPKFKEENLISNLKSSKMRSPYSSNEEKISRSRSS